MPVTAPIMQVLRYIIDDHCDRRSRPWVRNMARAAYSRACSAPSCRSSVAHRPRSFLSWVSDDYAAMRQTKDMSFPNKGRFLIDFETASLVAFGCAAARRLPCHLPHTHAHRMQYHHYQNALVREYTNQTLQLYRHRRLWFPQAQHVQACCRRLACQSCLLLCDCIQEGGPQGRAVSRCSLPLLSHVESSSLSWTL